MPYLHALLDTDILSKLLKRHPMVTAHARRYLREHGHLAFSLITRYEILKGLKAKHATTQLAAFERFCRINLILPLDDTIVNLASDIYARLREEGLLIPDADILIASTAQASNRTLVTNNLTHFERIPGLQVVNWKDQALEG